MAKNEGRTQKGRPGHFGQKQGRAASGKSGFGSFRDRQKPSSYPGKGPGFQKQRQAGFPVTDALEGSGKTRKTGPFAPDGRSRTGEGRRTAQSLSADRKNPPIRGVARSGSWKQGESGYRGRPGPGNAVPALQAAPSFGDPRERDGGKGPGGKGPRKYQPGFKPAFGPAKEKRGSFPEPVLNRKTREGFRTEFPAGNPLFRQRGAGVQGRGPSPAPVQAVPDISRQPGRAPGAEAPVNLLYGRNPIREALKAGRDIEKMLVARGDLSGSAREIVALAQQAGTLIQYVDRARLDEITHAHQGMVAFASAHAYASLEEVLDLAKERGEDPFLVVLNSITDPQNLGAVIRTAACVGAHGVVVPLHRAAGLTPAAVKASAGAVEHVRVARVKSLSQTIRVLKEKGVWVYAADAAGEDYRKVSFAGPCALIIGGESEGVGTHLLQLSDRVVSLPMKGALGSLNASVAAGVLMYAVFASR